jgi:CubicO group peptidase (beta-lactamase class C family)
MVAHLNVPALTQKGLPSSLSRDVIQKLLIEEMGFKGLVVTDALNMKGVSEYNKVKNIDLTAFKAGHDMLLISNDISGGIKAIAKAYKRGEITENRLSHSVKKVLKAKYKVGLANYKPIKTENLINELNTPLDTLLYTESMGKALTLLKNKNSILPFKSTMKLGHIPLGDASSAAFNNHLKNYGSIHTINDVTVANALEKTVGLDTLLVSFHRSNDTPWKASNFNKEELNIIKKLASNKTLILDVFVKPYALSALNGIKGIEALLLSYQNSTISQKLSVDALFGAHPVSGRLPVNISESLQEGAGMSLDGSFRLGFSSPAEVGFDTTLLSAVDRLAYQAIDSMMTPGMRILAARKGKIFYNKSFGYHTYKNKQQVKSTDIYDLASLTKILGTLPLVIQSVQTGKLTLETTIAELLPEWSNSNKASISLREMLSHYTRLTPWIPFYKETLNKKGYPKKSIYQSKPSPKFSLTVANDLYLKSDFGEELYSQIKESELLDTLDYKYSDLPYYILKKYYETSSSLPYNKLIEESIFKPLGLKNIRFKPLEQFDSDEIVPSEIDTYFRHQELDGHVHDMGAAMQNGVGGHAGLFGDAESVASIMQMYLQKGIYNGIQLLDSETISTFNVCYYCSEGNRRGVGFDKPQSEGKHISTCGCVSMKSFGHSGYTGTYAWADPEKELLIVILANRTYPNDDFTYSKSNIRTRLQEHFYNALID